MTRKRKSDAAPPTAPLPVARPSRPGDPGHPVTGRPSPLVDPRIVDQIVQAVAAGTTQKAAAERVGMTERAMERWMARGRASIHAVFDAREAGEPEPEPDEPYHTMAVRVMEARGRIEVTAVASIVQKFKDDWKAAAWWLERARSHEWGDNRRVTLAGDAEAPVMVAAAPAQDLWSAEERARLVIAALAEAGVAGMREAGEAIEARTIG